MRIRRRLMLFAVLALVAAALSPVAHAAGGHYTVDGGTPAERSQVRLALEASSFNWDIVPATVAVHVARGVDSRAEPGQIWVDADLLDSGRYAWGVVQHEYAHQVDFLVLTDEMRAQLRTRLGGVAWWGNGSAPHSSLTSERFADEIAWSYWASSDNCLRPLSTADEGGQVAPAAFRALLASLLPGSQAAERALAAVLVKIPHPRGFPSGNTRLHSVHR